MAGSALDFTEYFQLSMHNKQKNLLPCLLMVAVWISDDICRSLIVKLDSGQIRVEIYYRRGTRVVKGPSANQH